MSLEIEHFEKDFRLVIQLEGYLDMSTFKEFEIYTIKSIQPSTKKLGINLHKCKAIDSSGLGCLIRLTNELKKRNIEFSLFDIPSNIRGIIRISKIESYLTVEDSESFYGESK
jgi:anti-anti-sigma factor